MDELSHTVVDRRRLDLPLDRSPFGQSARTVNQVTLPARNTKQSHLRHRVRISTIPLPLRVHETHELFTDNGMLREVDIANKRGRS